MHADAGKGAHLFSSRPAPEHRTALRSATRSPRSRLCARRAARGGETRARRRDRTPDYAQSALLPRPSARSFVSGPISPSFKKFTHTPLPLYLAAARRAQVDGRSSSTRARSVHRDARRDIRRVRVRARVGGAVPPSHPTPTGGSGRRSVARQLPSLARAPSTARARALRALSRNRVAHTGARALSPRGRRRTRLSLSFRRASSGHTAKKFLTSLRSKSRTLRTPKPTSATRARCDP